MKISSDYKLRNISGEYVLTCETEENIDMNRLISLNESAAYLWDKLKVLENFDEKDMVSLLKKEYDVPEEQALSDCHELINEWLEMNIIQK